MPVYDVHAHIVPSELMDYLRADGAKVGLELFTTADGKEKLRVAGRQELGPFPAELFDLDARFAAMDEGGVDVQLVGHRTEFSAYALPADHGARYARAFNQILADLVGRHPSRLLGLGTNLLSVRNMGIKVEMAANGHLPALDPAGKAASGQGRHHLGGRVAVLDPLLLGLIYNCVSHRMLAAALQGAGQG